MYARTHVDCTLNIQRALVRPTKLPEKECERYARNNKDLKWEPGFIVAF